MWEVTWSTVYEGTQSCDYFSLADALHKVVGLAADRLVENIRLEDHR